MRREVRWVLLAGAVVAVLGAAALALALAPQEAPQKQVTLQDAAYLDVRRVALHNAHGDWTIAFNGEGYAVGDLPATLVDLTELRTLLTNCAQIEALQRVAEAPADLALYGLAEPAARIEISYADATALTLLIGDQERISGGYYVALAGEPAVYLLAGERVEGFLLPQTAYIEDQVTPPLALSSPLSAIRDVTFRGGQLAAPVTIEAVATGGPDVARAALSLGAPTHIVRGRNVYELDQTYGVEMLGALLGITARDVVGYGLSAEEIAAFGFDQPTMQVSFALQNGLDAPLEHYDLAVLRKGGACYLTCNDNGVIYVIDEPAFLQLSYDKLIVRWFLSPLLPDVSAIDIVSGGESYHFALSGHTNADRQVTCNGQPLDIERFRTFYQLLISAAHDGELLTDVTVSGEPLLQVTYHYLDEAKAPDVMALYPGDTRRVYVQLNGVTELAMREMYVTRVQQALAALWTDAPIETDW